MLVAAELDALLAARRGAFVHYARRFCFHHSEAEDAVQDACLKAWRYRHTFVGQGDDLARWFYRVLSTTIYDRRRKGYRQHEVPVDFVPDLAEDAEPGPEARAVHAELQAQTAALLTRLSAESAACLRLRWAGFTQPQIAARTGWPVNTVKTRIWRAQSRMRTLREDPAAPARKKRAVG